MDNLFALLLLVSLFLFVIGLFNPKTSLFWDKKERTKKKSAAIYGGLTILFFILFGTTSDIKNPPTPKDIIATVDEPKQSKPSKPKKNNDMPTEQKLAILDAETFVDTTDLKVIRIKTLLNSLASMYNEPRDTIAEYTSKAQGVLHDRGIKESCLNILEGMRKGGKLDNTPYKDAVTLYIMIADYNQ